MLGLVQGATELLPISSSGHLILVPWLADWQYLMEDDRFNQTFDVALHVGTLLAVVAYFRADLVRLAVAFWGSLRRRRIESADERIAWFIAAATVPAAIIGRARRGADRRQPRRALADRDPARGLRRAALDRRPAARRRATSTTSRSGGSFAVGLAQTLALAPGVSRSGITITAGRFLGLDRDSAARFSFLLLVPITLGAVLWKGLTDVVLGDLPPGSAGPFVVGTIASAVSGFAAIVFLLALRAHALVRHLRRLPADRVGDRPAADRDRRPQRRRSSVSRPPRAGTQPPCPSTATPSPARSTRPNDLVAQREGGRGRRASPSR